MEGIIENRMQCLEDFFFLLFFFVEVVVFKGFSKC